MHPGASVVLAGSSEQVRFGIRLASVGMEPQQGHSGSEHESEISQKCVLSGPTLGPSFDVDKIQVRPRNATGRLFFHQHRATECRLGCRNVRSPVSDKRPVLLQGHRQ